VLEKRFLFERSCNVEARLAGDYQGFCTISVSQNRLGDDAILFILKFAVLKQLTHKIVYILVTVLVGAILIYTLYWIIAGLIFIYEYCTFPKHFHK
jgi:hypothetical protein